MEKEKEIYDLLGQIIVEEIQTYLVTKNKLLKNNGLVQSIDYEVRQNQLEILAADYYEYYVKGRRPFARKVPIFALIKWIQRYRFKAGRGRDARGRFITDNQYAFAIQTAIYKNGIKKKEDAVAIVLKRNEGTINEIIDSEFEKIIDEELNKIFE